MLILNFLALIVAVLFVHWLVRFLLATRDGMPVPRSALVPIFGATIKAGLNLGNIHKEGLKEVLKYGKNTGLLRGFLFHQPVVGFWQPEYLKVLFDSQWRIFDRNSLEQDSFAPVLGGGIILANNGPEWKRGRDILDPAFSPKALRRYLELFRERAEVCVQHLRQRLAAGELPVDMQLLFQQVAFDITCRVALGSQLTTTGQDTRFFHAWEDLLTDLAFRFFVPIPLWLRRLFRTPSITKFDRALQLLDDIVYATIRSASSQEDSLLAALLREREKQLASGDPNPLTDKQIRDHLLTLLMAAHDTTTNLMTFAIYYIASQPGLDDQVQEELRTVVGTGQPLLEEHIPRLELLKKVFFETLRLRPSAPLRGRTLTQDIELTNPNTGHRYRLPAGSHAAWSAYLIHRHPTLWPDPDTFDHRRFDPDVAKARMPYSFVPFGAGPRRCLGEAFALREATMVIATLLQHFRFQLVPGTPVEDEFALTLHSKYPMLMTFTPRNS